MHKTAKGLYIHTYILFAQTSANNDKKCMYSEWVGQQSSLDCAYSCPWSER